MDKFYEEAVKVPFGAKHLDAVLCVPTGSVTRSGVILTHGAGGDMNFCHLVSLAHSLASSGFLCLRFTCKGLNLVYRVRAYHAVWVSKCLSSALWFNMINLVIIASCNVSPQEYLKSLQRFTLKHIFVGGQTQAHQQRSADLRGLPEHMPVLFVSGSEDNMCDRVLLQRLVKEMKAQSEVFWLNGGNHGLRVPGRTEESILEDVNSRVITWMRKWAA
ncbi:testis-expressed protein 30 isoform 3-T3 [Aulostomus maculatus]